MDYTVGVYWIQFQQQMDGKFPGNSRRDAAAVGDDMNFDYPVVLELNYAKL
jgi:hypothetical protein